MAVLDEILETAELAREWRAPTPGEHVCQGCGAAAGFGLGHAWFCRRCLPAGFLPKDRRPGQ